MERERMPGRTGTYPDGTRDHQFTKSEKFDYDRLAASGRTAYDQHRWYDGMTHAQAFNAAVIIHGLNKYYTTYGKVGI